MLIRSQGARVVKVTEPDSNGGYLLNRIKKVKELVAEIDNSYWVNQYGNPHNAEAYYHTLGGEICDAFEHLDYIFMGVSSGGTITGVSNRIKEKFPGAKVVGVDIVGSVIFGHPAKKRYIPGIGSSLVPNILGGSRIDQVIMVDELTTIRMCHEILSEHSIFAGGSSGSVFAAVKQCFSSGKGGKKANVVMLFADKGERYANTVYSKEWYSDFIYKRCFCGRWD
jgi:cysteine synthase A